MRRIFLVFVLFLLTTCSTAPLRSSHIVEHYGEPDEIVLQGPIQLDENTGIYYDSLLIYNLPLSVDSNNPDQRIIFLMDDSVVGIAVFNADNTFYLEDFPSEPMIVHFQKMFPDFVWV